MWRKYRISLSLANLVYVRAWADLIPLRSGGLYHRKILPGFNLYFALVGDVIALSLAIYLLIRIAPLLPAWLRRFFPAAAIAVLAFATTFLRAHLPHVPTALLAFLFVAAEVLALLFSRTAAGAIKGLALAATPCLAVTLLAPIYYLSRPSPLPPDPPLAARLPGTPPVRVLWIVFDEWDQRLTFGDDATSNTAAVPTLVSYAARSFAGRRTLAAEAGVVPVYDMATMVAIPSLLYGKLVVGSETDDPATRHLMFADGRSAILGTGQSIFARARSLGWNSAIAGWFLPYCRVFASQVTDCWWDEMYDQSSSASRQPVQAGIDETRMLFESQMYSPFGRSLVVMRHTQEYEDLIAAAQRYAADPSLGVAFVHLNVPHMPYLDKPGIGHLLHSGPNDDLYVNELRWVDNAVAEILSALNKSGLESRTAVILSSDHPARLVSKLTPYVPFIVHLPGYDSGLPSYREFSALRSADLVLAIAKGEVRSPLDVESFMIKH